MISIKLSRSSWISLYICYMMTSVENKHLKCLLVSLITDSLTSYQTQTKLEKTHRSWRDYCTAGLQFNGLDSTKQKICSIWYVIIDWIQPSCTVIVKKLRSYLSKIQDFNPHTALIMFDHWRNFDRRALKWSTARSLATSVQRERRLRVALCPDQRQHDDRERFKAHSDAVHCDQMMQS